MVEEKGTWLRGKTSLLVVVTGAKLETMLVAGEELADMLVVVTVEAVEKAGESLVSSGKGITVEVAVLVTTG